MTLALSWSTGKDAAWTLHLLRKQRIELEDAIADLERTVVVVDGMLKEREAAAPKAANG